MKFSKESILSGDTDQLITVLKTRYTTLDHDQEVEASRVQRLAIASSIHPDKTIAVDWGEGGLKKLAAEIQKEFSLSSPAFNAEIQFTMQILQSFKHHSQIDKQLLPYFCRLNDVILAHALADTRFWLKKHPLLDIVEYLYQQMRGWQDKFGKNSDSLRDVLAKTVDDVVAVELMDTGGFNEALAKAKEAFDAITKRFDKLTERLKSTETGVLKNRFANEEVIRFANKISRGRQLPQPIFHYFQSVLVNEMKLLVIKDGGRSSDWLKLQKLFEMLFKLYQEGNGNQPDEITKNMLQQLPNDLTAALNACVPESNELTEFLNVISYDFVQIMLGNAVGDMADIPLMELGEGKDIDVEQQVSKALLKQARTFKEGQWFVYKDEGQQLKRVKLALSLPAFGQLMFCNVVGQKAFVATYEEFAYLLSSKKAMPLREAAIIDISLEAVLDILLKDIDQVYEARQSALKRKIFEEKQEAERKAKAIAKAKEEKERKIAEEKARAEAEAIAERKRVEEQRLLMQQMADDMRRQARLALDTLSLGSWIEWMDPETNIFRRIKLALKFNATGRFVFVDEDGVNVAEHQRDELVEMVLVRKVKLLSGDTKFADRLAKIVTSIRVNE